MAKEYKNLLGIFIHRLWHHNYILDFPRWHKHRLLKILQILEQFEEKGLASTDLQKADEVDDVIG